VSGDLSIWTLFDDMQNRSLGPYLMTSKRILISVMYLGNLPRDSSSKIAMAGQCLHTSPPGCSKAHPETQ
jgi:hypothetical protein